MSANSEYDLSQPYEGKSVPTYASDDTSDRADELTRLRGEVEQLQVQLAGCGAAALGATKDPVTKGEYGWSPAYQDVLNLRLEVESLRRSNEGFEAHFEVLQRENESLRKQIAEQEWQPSEDPDDLVKARAVAASIWEHPDESVEKYVVAALLRARADGIESRTASVTANSHEAARLRDLADREEEK